MKRWSMVLAAFVTTASLTAGLAAGQPKSADCDKARAPEKVEGQVVRVDLNAGKLTVKEKNGTTHEFQATREMLQNMKPGDQIEAKLREVPKC